MTNSASERMAPEMLHQPTSLALGILGFNPSEALAPRSEASGAPARRARMPGAVVASPAQDGDPGTPASRQPPAQPRENPKPSDRENKNTNTWVDKPTFKPTGKAFTSRGAAPAPQLGPPGRLRASVGAAISAIKPRLRAGTASSGRASGFSPTASKHRPRRHNLFQPARDGRQPPRRPPAAPGAVPPQDGDPRPQGGRRAGGGQHPEHLQGHAVDFALCYGHGLDFTTPPRALTRRHSKNAHPLPCPKPEALWEP